MEIDIKECQTILELIDITYKTLGANVHSKVHVMKEKMLKAVEDDAKSSHVIGDLK